MDFWIWIVIAIFVLLGKAWNALSSQIDGETPKSEPKPAPPPRARPRPRPATARKPTGGWHAGQEELKKFFEQMQRSTPPPKLPRTKPSPLPPMAQPVTRAAPAPAAPPKPVPSQPATPARATQWAAALRDRQNLRHIILSAEIIGPPKAFQ
jgi:hypothetical protein